MKNAFEVIAETLSMSDELADLRVKLADTQAELDDLRIRFARTEKELDAAEQTWQPLADGDGMRVSIWLGEEYALCKRTQATTVANAAPGEEG